MVESAMSRSKAFLFAAGITTIVVAVPVLAARSVRSAPHRVDVAVEGFTDGQQWHFTPRTIRAVYGDTIHVVFSAVGAGHGFRVQGKNVDLTAYPGMPQQATFVADWVGGKEYYCTFDCGPGHAQMSGMIVVTRRGE
jgi:heme/copper-type cytochrome/quinol oxidase subunit 2